MQLYMTLKVKNINYLTNQIVFLLSWTKNKNYHTTK